jgi:hypothetical protein
MPVSPSDSGISPTCEQYAGLREAYLNWLMEQARAVPLAGIDRKSIRKETRRDLELAAVYTALLTERQEAATERELRSSGREAKRLSALAVLNAEKRLALLGDSGSGKSTFVNFVALCMAGELLGRAEANLAVLRAPVPENEEIENEDKDRPPQPWDHAPLLPIRVVLREFVARGLPPAGQSIEINSDTLWRFIIAELPKPCTTL